jgi:hypothetical protein
LALEALDYRDAEHLVLISDPSGIPFHDLGESGVKSIIASTIGRYGALPRRRKQGGLHSSEALR